MAGIDKTGYNDTSNTEQWVLNNSVDREFNVLAVENLGFDGTSLQREISGCTALKVTTSGDVKYVAVAPPGTLQSEAKWQVQKIDTSSGTVITWADGNANFDNVATDLTALTYS